MKRNEEKSEMGDKKRSRKVVQNDQYLPSSASLKYIVGSSSRHTLRYKEVYNQGKEDTSPVGKQNLKKQALKFLRSERFNETNLIPVAVRTDGKDHVPTKRTEKTSVANFKEMASVMKRSSLRVVKDEDDDVEKEAGATVAENVLKECAQNISIAHGFNVTETVNRVLRPVKVDDDEIESSMHPVFGNIKGRGAGDVANNVTTERTSIAHSMNVTEMARMMNRGPRDVDDEIVSSRHPNSVNVEGYKVKPEVAPLFRKIILKHGDIGRNCNIRCPVARGRVVEFICSVYQSLNDTNLMSVTDVELEGMLKNVQIENFDVKWLSDRLQDILNTRKMLKEYPLMKEEEAKEAEAIRKKETKITRYRKKLFDAEAELQLTKGDFEKVSRNNKNLKERVNAYMNKSLVHGLV